MALPASITPCLMTGTFLDDQGNPVQGAVALEPSVPEVTSASGQAIIQLRDKMIQLDSNGSFAVALIPTDANLVTPSGVYWTLTALTFEAPFSLTFTVPVAPSADITGFITSISPAGSTTVQIGPPGRAGTISIDSVTTGPVASVINVGTVTDAAFAFVLPDGGGIPSTEGIAHVVKITQTAYDALATKDSSTLYVIVG